MSRHPRTHTSPRRGRGGSSRGVGGAWLPPPPRSCSPLRHGSWRTRVPSAERGSGGQVETTSFSKLLEALDSSSQHKQFLLCLPPEAAVSQLDEFRHERTPLRLSPDSPLTPDQKRSFEGCATSMRTRADVRDSPRALSRSGSRPDADHYAHVQAYNAMAAFASTSTGKRPPYGLPQRVRLLPAVADARRTRTSASAPTVH